MPTIRTQCPCCRHHIDLGTSACALLGGHDGRPVAYAFVCSHCGTAVVRRADETAAAMLVAGGVSPCGVAEHTVRPTYPERRVSGPPLTPDDLIDFHALLDGTRWFEHLAASSQPG